MYGSSDPGDIHGCARKTLSPNVQNLKQCLLNQSIGNARNAGIPDPIQLGNFDPLDQSWRIRMHFTPVGECLQGKDFVLEVAIKNVNGRLIAGSYFPLFDIDLRMEAEWASSERIFIAHGDRLSWPDS